MPASSYDRKRSTAGQRGSAAHSAASAAVIGPPWKCKVCRDASESLA